MKDKILIIGGGSSAAKLLGHEKEVRGFFDEIIIVGGIFQLFDAIADIHLITEKHFTEHDMLNKGNYRKDLLRLVNFKTPKLWNPKYNIEGITRSQKTLDFQPDKLMRVGNTPALLTGGIGSDGTALGSVLLQAIHLASTHQPSRIYLVGAEMCFTEPDRDHAYQDGKYYRTAVSTHPNAAKYEVRNGIESTGYFFESAPVVDEFINNEFSKTQFYNFSGGLLKAPMPLEFSAWLEGLDRYNAFLDYAQEEEGAASDEDD